MLSEEKQHLTEKENFPEDNKLLSSNSLKTEKYELSGRQQSKKENRETIKPKRNTASNQLNNETDVSNINQCKYGNQNMVTLRIMNIIISLVICNARCKETIG